MASNKRGRKVKIVDEDQVLSLKAIGLKWNQISELIGISERTLRKRRKYFQHDASSYSPLENETLDYNVGEILDGSPNSGERMVIGALLARNIKVQRSRVRDSLNRVNPERQSLHRRILRRVYSVASPNALW